MFKPEDEAQNNQDADSAGDSVEQPQHTPEYQNSQENANLIIEVGNNQYDEMEPTESDADDQ